MTKIRTALVGSYAQAYYLAADYPDYTVVNASISGETTGGALRRLDDLLIDWSKCAVTPDTMRHLADLADAAGVAEKRDAMFAGKAINRTEQRAVLHTALRNRSGNLV